MVDNKRGNDVRQTKPRHQRLSASPPALCFPRFAGFTNSDLWFPEEGGEWLAMEMEGLVLGLFGGGDMVDN